MDPIARVRDAAALQFGTGSSKKTLSTNHMALQAGDDAVGHLLTHHKSQITNLGWISRKEYKTQQ